MTSLHNATVHQIWWNAYSALAFYRWGFAFRLFWFRFVLDLGQAYVD